jgi:hypothetical protein
MDELVELAFCRRMVAVALKEAFGFPAAKQVEEPAIEEWEPRSARQSHDKGSSPER